MMRLPLLIMFVFLRAAIGQAASYSNVVQTVQNFSNGGAIGSWATVTGLQASATGYTNWGYYGSSTNFESWRIVTVPDFQLPIPLQAGSTLFTSSGTRGVQYEMGTGNDVEALDLQTPGGAVYNFSNMLVKAFIKLSIYTTNFVAADFDHFYTEGGTFCGCQTVTRSGQWIVKAHSQLNNGASNNGIEFHFNPEQWYYMELLRDRVRSLCILRFFDPVTYALVGESSATMGDNFGSFRNRTQAHYLDLGNTFGTTTVSMVTITYSNATPAVNMVMPIEALIRSNRFEWIPGTNVGVRGGIQERSGTIRDATLAPYFADKTGATDAGADINTTINASSSNDVVYLPAGLYHADTAITMKSGVTLRGAGSGLTIIVGSIIVPSTGTGEYFDIASGGDVGSTNLSMFDVTDAFARTIEANDVLEISQVENDTDNVFPVWSVSNSKRTLAQMVHVASRSGTNLTLYTPLMRNFTNSAKLLGHSLALNYVRGVGIEYLTVTSTNSGLSETPVWLINLAGAMDSWVRGCSLEYPISYCLSMERNLNNQVESNYLGHATSIGNSRSGITAASGSFNLIQNNVFEDLSIGWQAQGGSWSGNAMAYNFFTNISDKAILDHTTHTFYNLYEGNKINTIVHDGYFGSQSHDDIFRNKSPSTTRANRNVTFMQYIGNVLGDPAFSFAYDEQAVGGNFHIFRFGDPHIGNTNHSAGQFHPPMAHNFPGPTTTGSGNTYTNPGNRFTVTVTTNVVHTNMTDGVRGFTNYPAGSATTFQLAFQDDVNTNKWYPDDGTILYATLAGTATNLTLNVPITISNGWTLFIVGSEAFNQKNLTNRYTHFYSDNHVYTNSAGVWVSDGRTADRSLPPTLLYIRTGTPIWYHKVNGDSLLLPAIGPDVVGLSTMIPAEDWHAAMQGGGGPPESPPERRFSPGRVLQRGRNGLTR